MTSIEIAGEVLGPGDRQRFDLPVALLPTHTQMTMPLEVLHSGVEGPRLWVSAAIHGDELNGIEVIRRVLREVRSIEVGTLFALPIVNVFGFIHQSRYLPDRRDLNRSFPGSARGPLASRLAHMFRTMIVEHCTHGIDLHTGSLQKSNYPQVRGDLDNAETRRCADAFGAPVMVHSTLRDGSLRASASKLGIPVLLYEAGEAQRFNDHAIEVGTRGVLGVMQCLGMISGQPEPEPSAVVKRSKWVRAKRGGLLRLAVNEGDRVAKGQLLCSIADPLGDDAVRMFATNTGVVIGQANNPVVHAGDAILHIGETSEDDPVGSS